MDEGTWPYWEIGIRLLEVLKTHCSHCLEEYLAYVDSLGLDDLSSLEARKRAHSVVTKGLVEMRRAFERDEEAREDLETLQRAPADGRGAIVAAQPGRFRSPLLVEGLLAEAEHRLDRRPDQALGWLEIAAEVHRRLDEESGGGGPYDDQRLRIRLLQARAHFGAGDRKRAARLQLDLLKARAAKPPPSSRVQKEITQLEEALTR